MGSKYAFLLIQTFVIVFGNTNRSSSECRECGRGFGLVKHCTKDHDTICEPCLQGTYKNTTSNKLCQICKECEENYYIKSKCTILRNTECVPCTEKLKNTNNIRSYNIKCIEDFKKTDNSKELDKELEKYDNVLSNTTLNDSEVSLGSGIADMEESSGGHVVVKFEDIDRISNSPEIPPTKIMIKATESSNSSLSNFAAAESPSDADHGQGFQWPLLVAGLVAAVLFFIVGMAVSAYIRRRRNKNQKSKNESQIEKQPIEPEEDDIKKPLIEKTIEVEVVVPQHAENVCQSPPAITKEELEEKWKNLWFIDEFDDDELVSSLGRPTKAASGDGRNKPFRHHTLPRRAKPVWSYGEQPADGSPPSKPPRSFSYRGPAKTWNPKRDKVTPEEKEKLLEGLIIDVPEVKKEPDALIQDNPEEDQVITADEEKGGVEDETLGLDEVDVESKPVVDDEIKPVEEDKEPKIEEEKTAPEEIMPLDTTDSSEPQNEANEKDNSITMPPEEEYKKTSETIPESEKPSDADDSKLDSEEKEVASPEPIKLPSESDDDNLKETEVPHNDLFIDEDKIVLPDPELSAENEDHLKSAVDEAIKDRLNPESEDEEKLKDAVDEAIKDRLNQESEDEEKLKDVVDDILKQKVSDDDTVVKKDDDSDDEFTIQMKVAGLAEHEITVKEGTLEAVKVEEVKEEDGAENSITNQENEDTNIQKTDDAEEKQEVTVEKEPEAAAEESETMPVNKEESKDNVEDTAHVKSRKKKRKSKHKGK